MGSASTPDQNASRERDPHPALLVFVSGVLLVAAGGLLVFVKTQDKGNEVIGAPASFDAPREAPQRQTSPVLTDLSSILDAPDPASLRGRMIALRDVPVQAVVGDYTFWIGTGPRRRVPVVLLGERTARQPESQTEVRQAQRVNVFGMIRLLQDVRRIDESWAIDSRDREELRQEPVYISAEQVDVVQAAPR